MRIRLTTAPTGLEKARDEALLVLTGFDPILDKDNYETVLNRIHTLSTLIAAEQSERLSPNTVLLCAANIAIALKVIRYEDSNIITTKVLPFLLKHF